MLTSACAKSEPASSQPNERDSSRHGAGGPGVTRPSRRRSETSTPMNGARPSTTPYGPAVATPATTSTMLMSNRLPASPPSRTPYGPNRELPANTPAHEVLERVAGEEQQQADEEQGVAVEQVVDQPRGRDQREDDQDPGEDRSTDRRRA